jgi:hypothetical protein
MQDKFMDIQAYNLAEFCQKVQQAFNAGYEFDFDDNARYPTSFGTFYSAGMKLKVASTAAVASEPLETASVELSTESDTNVPTEAKDDPTAAKRSKAKY